MRIKPQDQQERDVCIVEGCTRPTEKFINDDPSYYCGKHGDVLVDEANASREWREAHG